MPREWMRRAQSSVVHGPIGAVALVAVASLLLPAVHSARAQEIATLVHGADVRGIALSPDGATLASTDAAADNAIRLWNIASGQQIATLLGHTDRVDSVAFSPLGGILASGSVDRTIKLWDLGSNTVIATFSGHTAQVETVAFSPNGLTLASGSLDRNVKLWGVASEQLITTLTDPGLPTAHGHWVWSVAFSPDGATLASGSFDDTIKLWDVDSFQLLATLTGHTGNVQEVEFSPDGSTLATASADTFVKLWDVSTGSPTLTLTLGPHPYIVQSIAFSSLEATLATGGRLHPNGDPGGFVKLWDLSTGLEKAALLGHTHLVMRVRYSPDGTILASGGFDDTVKLWAVGPGVVTPTLSVAITGPASNALTQPGDAFSSANDNAVTADIMLTLESGDEPVTSIDLNSVFFPGALTFNGNIPTNVSIETTDATADWSVAAGPSMISGALDIGLVAGNTVGAEITDIEAPAGSPLPILTLTFARLYPSRRMA